MGVTPSTGLKKLMPMETLLTEPVLQVTKPLTANVLQLSQGIIVLLTTKSALATAKQSVVAITGVVPAHDAHEKLMK